MLVTGLLGAIKHRVGRSDRVDYPRRCFRVRGASEAHGVDGILIPALDKIFFEAQFSDRSIDAGFNSRIAHRQECVPSRRAFRR